MHEYQCVFCQSKMAGFLFFLSILLIGAAVVTVGFPVDNIADSDNLREELCPRTIDLGTEYIRVRRQRDTMMAEDLQLHENSPFFAAPYPASYCADQVLSRISTGRQLILVKVRVQDHLCRPRQSKQFAFTSHIRTTQGEELAAISDASVSDLRRTQIACHGWGTQERGLQETFHFQRQGEPESRSSSHDGVYGVLLSRDTTRPGKEDERRVSNDDRVWLRLEHHDASSGIATNLLTTHVDIPDDNQRSLSSAGEKQKDKLQHISPLCQMNAYMLKSIGSVDVLECSVNITLDTPTLNKLLRNQQSHDMAMKNSSRQAEKASSIRCDPHCMGDGSQCVDTGVCNCQAGFTGPLCTVPIDTHGKCGLGHMSLTPTTPLGGHYPGQRLVSRGVMCMDDPVYKSKSTVLLYLTIKAITSTCKVLPSALIEIWQADTSGIYTPGCSSLLKTNTKGEASVKSVRPASVHGLPRMLHIRVRNSTSIPTVLSTRLYFMGDPLRSNAQAMQTCGAECHTTDPRLSMICFFWGSDREMKCSVTVVLKGV